jgi:hypothetical protein
MYIPRIFKLVLIKLKQIKGAVINIMILPPPF